MDMPQEKIRTVLSIDWDFFFFRALEAEDVKKTVEVNGRPVSLWGFFDWGHSETQGGGLQTLLWHVRFLDFTRQGLDPYVIAGINKEFGCTDPDAFNAFVMKALGVKDANVNISDSHRHAYYTMDDAAQNAGAPVHVIHFDAHHDLGYGKRKYANRKNKVYDAEDWLYAALDTGIVKSVQVVYPNWRGLVEKEGSNLEHLCDYDVAFTTWDAWCKAPPINIEVVDIHIARSGAWVPPWFDKQFEEFTRMWSAPELTCMDCIVSGNSNQPHACEIRPWEDPKVDATDELDAFQQLAGQLPQPR